LRLSEVERSATALRHGIDNRVPINAVVTRRLYLMAARFEDIRACLGDRPLVVTSGYRCRVLNDITPGAAKNSYHRRLLALDLRPRISAQRALERILQLPFVAYAYRNSHRSVHVQWEDILNG